MICSHYNKTFLLDLEVITLNKRVREKKKIYELEQQLSNKSSYIQNK